MAKIKICGLFREEDADLVNQAAPDYVGFVFAESRRRVSPGGAAKIRARLRDDIIPVGVFVNAPVETVAALYRDGVIALVQLHGTEDAAYIARLREYCGAPVIKALAIPEGGAGGLFHGPPGADFVLLDHGAGGTGRAFDWAVLDGRKPALPFFLAGGVDLRNIGEALGRRPYGVDVSSGAETGGVKDLEKILSLVQTVRAADRCSECPGTIR
jgi:phosphoribosylanthranilate isomerase